MSEQFEQRLQRYADVGVRVGANVQPGQPVLIQADLGAADLARALARSAYQAGASYVDLWWDDEQVTLARYEHAPRDSFERYPEWRVAAMTALLDQGAAFIRVTSANPGLLAGQPADLVSAAQQAAARATRPIADRVRSSQFNWLILAAAAPGWAARVFPDAPADEQVARLWDAIFSACRIDDADPVAAWQAHVAGLAARREELNRRRYSALRLRGPGTDLTVGLVDEHRWMGGSVQSKLGIPFVPNLPTEEVFTMPHRERVSGVVRASKPLNLAGTLIEGFSLRFAEGRVVEAQAERGEEVLRRTIATDEGAARLGEVALVPASSPIGRGGTLFYNTLFDENAACHIALGGALLMNHARADELGPEELAAAGSNTSNIHVDFMVGSDQMDVDGLRADGSAEPLMRAGEWV